MGIRETKGCTKFFSNATVPLGPTPSFSFSFMPFLSLFFPFLELLNTYFTLYFFFYE